jgi:hypothetical protein
VADRILRQDQSCCLARALSRYDTPTPNPIGGSGLSRRASSRPWPPTCRIRGHDETTPTRACPRSLRYVANIPTTNMNGAAIVAASRDLYEVERSFRMAKSDLGARPIFHHQRDSIDAHLTIVLAALAVSREAQQRTGTGIKKIVTTLRPLASGHPRHRHHNHHRRLIWGWPNWSVDRRVASGR